MLDMHYSTESAAGYRAQDDIGVDHPSHSLKADLIRTAIRTNWVEGYRVLDLACGTGRFFRCIPGHDSVIVGIDASQHMLDQAMTPAGLVEPTLMLLQGDVGTMDLPLPYAYYHAVVCIGILGVYLPMSVEWLRKVKALMVEDGVLVLTVVGWQPAEDRERSWKQHLALAARPFLPASARARIDRRFASTHIHLTESQVRARVCAAGLRVVTLQPWESDGGRLDFLVHATL